MKRLKIILILLVVIFVALQFIQPDKSVPPVDSSLAVEQRTAITTEAAKIIGTACRDCHTYETIFPLHSYIFPVSWLVDYDVRAGREHLNFSVWGNYESQEAWVLLDEICDQIMEDKMPPKRYLLVHPEANLDNAAKKAVCDWTETEKKQYE